MVYLILIYIFKFVCIKRCKMWVNMKNVMNIDNIEVWSLLIKKKYWSMECCFEIDFLLKYDILKI